MLTPRQLVISSAVLLVLALLSYAAYQIDQLAISYLTGTRRVPGESFFGAKVRSDGPVPGYIYLGRSKPSERPPGFRMVRLGGSSTEIGLQLEDIVTSVSGQTYRSSRDLFEDLVKNRTVGESLSLTVLRGKKQIELSLKLKPFLRSPADLNLPFEEVEISSTSGYTLQGWFIPPPKWSDGRTGVFVHGAKSSRFQGLEGAAYWYQRGYGLLTMDLSGRGTSEGKYVTYSVNERLDASSMLNWTRRHPSINKKQVVLFGTSNGGAAAIYAAAKDPLLPALALDAPYSNLWATALERDIPPLHLQILSWAVWLRTGINLAEIQPIQSITEIKAPVFFVHGDSDKQVLPHHSQHMVADRQTAGLPTELWIIPGGEHGFDNYPPPDIFWNKILDFYDQSLGGPPASKPKS
jgi:hypothetical protein